MTVRLAVNVMQSLALFGLMSAKWPETFEQISSSLQIFVLDMKNLSLNCLLGGNSALSYVASTVVFPLVLLWLVICHAVSRLICSRKCGLHRWKWPFTFNTMGLGLQLGFGTIAAVALKPMMCYKHLVLRISIDKPSNSALDFFYQRTGYSQIALASSVSVNQSLFLTSEVGHK